MPDRNVKLLFALFALSGFTGLIYESVWSHYLKLFLGAAAFAQSFVLAAFMGGMALGAWLASRWSARLTNLLAAYGWIEAAIGAAALIFHESFVLLTQLSLDHVIPALGSPGAVEIYKYSLCAALIVPQTALLGMTFPLLSGAVIRRGPEASGHHLAMLYFTNSIGAAIGALRRSSPLHATGNPRHLQRRLSAAPRSPQGTWSGFSWPVHSSPASRRSSTRSSG